MEEVTAAPESLFIILWVRFPTSVIWYLFTERLLGSRSYGGPKSAPWGSLSWRKAMTSWETGEFFSGLGTVHLSVRSFVHSFKVWFLSCSCVSGTVGGTRGSAGDKADQGPL